MANTVLCYVLVPIDVWPRVHWVTDDYCSEWPRARTGRSGLVNGFKRVSDQCDEIHRRCRNIKIQGLTVRGECSRTRMGFLQDILAMFRGLEGTEFLVRTERMITVTVPGARCCHGRDR